MPRPRGGPAGGGGARRWGGGRFRAAAGGARSSSLGGAAMGADCRVRPVRPRRGGRTVRLRLRGRSGKRDERGDGRAGGGPPPAVEAAARRVEVPADRPVEDAGGEAVPGEQELERRDVPPPAAERERAASQPVAAERAERPARAAG